MPVRVQGPYVFATVIVNCVKVAGIEVGAIQTPGIQNRVEVITTNLDLYLVQIL